MKKLFKTLGPGLLYAGAAVGVSHLVQSTRAGAQFGFELAFVLILANLIKYPFFEFGPRYASATGKSLIDGYQKTGRWAVHLYSILTLTTMFAIQAAVTVVTAGLVGNIFHSSLNYIQLSAIILVVIAILLFIGRYSLLDNLIKYIIILLAISTLLAVIFATSKGVDTAKFEGWQFHINNPANLIFLVAFIGWMPAPIDISVWHSLWSQAKNEEMKEKSSLKQSLLDFNIGYIGTIFLALGFLTLGALIMFGSGEELSSKGVVFSGQLISMYTTSLGNWAYWIIAVAALTTMFSTTLTVFDAYPRVIQSLTPIYFPKQKDKSTQQKTYWIAAIILFAGTLALMQVSKGKENSAMTSLINLATHLSFVTAPLFAVLNLLAVKNKQLDPEFRPKKAYLVFSYICLVVLTAFSIYYIVWKFF